MLKAIGIPIGLWPIAFLLYSAGPWFLGLLFLFMVVCVFWATVKRPVQQY
jgi:hypothetical protein